MILNLPQLCCHDHTFISASVLVDPVGNVQSVLDQFIITSMLLLYLRAACYFLCVCVRGLLTFKNELIPSEKFMYMYIESIKVSLSNFFTC